MPAHRVTSLVSLLVATACASPGVGARGPAGAARAPVAPAPVTDERCLLPTGALSTDSHTITIGLTEPVDPHHAPLARNDAERIVFRQLYEAPIRFDCEGRAVPELADKWTKEDDGRRWTFRLRDNAQFWDGAPLTAQEVVFGKGGLGYTLGALEAHVVTVMLAKPQDDVPTVLGDPGLAVTKPAPDSSWPIGTGAYWATSATTTAQEIRAHSTRGDTLVFKLATSGNARDLLDGGVDLLITRDRTLRDYAATLPNHSVTALPWDRTYVYVTADAGSARLDGGDLEQSVRAEARRPEGGFWWLDLRGCGVSQSAPAAAPTAGGQHRILYVRSDVTARELAGRLAALTHGVASGRDADDFSNALAAGKDWGYVVALPRVTSDPCRTAKALLPAWAATFTALLDTRATAIARHGVARWTVDQDGTVHLAP